MSEISLYNRYDRSYVYIFWFDFKNFKHLGKNMHMEIVTHWNLQSSMVIVFHQQKTKLSR